MRTLASNGASGVDADVAIVGYGPVGQALAALLGLAGHSVVVFERHRAIYHLPRAVHLDHEIMRLLQALGLGAALAEEMIPVRDYQWFGSDGEPLLRFDVPVPARSGWESSYLFFQPELEAALDRLGCAEPGVTVERGWVAEGLVDTADCAHLTVRRIVEDERGRPVRTQDTRTVRARWVVGADGANSFVREASGIGRRDLGFKERWGGGGAPPPPMIRRVRRRTCNAARATAAGSSCCWRTSRPPTSTTRRACGRCWSRGSGPRTVRSLARRSTSSARCWPSGCVRGTCCSPATPRT
jgi:2-polyprenyl-6-methoxyphenol hydroxylase-like FAD-dependent oxidoreductase